MGKIALLFSGQGAQKPGMANSLLGCAASKNMFERLEKIRPGLIELCTSASAKELNLTINTQPAVFAMSAAAYALYKEGGGEAPQYMAGFSLGEYAALAAANVLSFEEAFRLVIKRAQWMHECTLKEKGGMAAVLGLNDQELDNLIEEAGQEFIAPVNFNCPGQTVVTGDENSLSNFLSLCKQKKIKAIPLPVSGMFHSKYMEPAAEKIKIELNSLNFNTPKVKIYSNVTGRPYGDDIKGTLYMQVKSPVCFRQIIEDMLLEGADTFIELGVGSTLTGFVKRMAKEALLYTIDSEQGFCNYISKG